MARWVGVVFCLSLFLFSPGAAGLGGAINTWQGGVGPNSALVPIPALHSPHIRRTLHPIADDGPTHFSAQIGTLGVFPFSAFSLALIPLTLCIIQRDLLNLTQRRRE